MKVTVPEQLRKLVDNNSEVEASGNTVQEVLDDLVNQFPDVKERLFKSNGEINRFINVYVNDEDIRFLSGTITPVKSSDVICILPMIAGG